MPPDYQDMEGNEMDDDIIITPNSPTSFLKAPEGQMKILIDGFTIEFEDTGDAVNMAVAILQKLDRL